MSARPKGDRPHAAFTSSVVREVEELRSAPSLRQRAPSNTTTPSITVATQCVVYSKGSPS